VKQKNLQVNKYKIVKLVHILMQGLFLALSPYIALSYKAGEVTEGTIALLVGMTLYSLDATIFWWLIEKNRS